MNETVGFRLPPDLVAALDHESARLGLTRTEIARRMVAATLASDVDRAVRDGGAAINGTPTAVVDVIRGLSTALPNALALLASTHPALAQQLALELLVSVDWIAYGQPRPDAADDTSAKVAALKARLADLLDQPEPAFESKTTGVYR